MKEKKNISVPLVKKKKIEKRFEAIESAAQEPEAPVVTGPLAPTSQKAIMPESKKAAPAKEEASVIEATPAEAPSVDNKTEKENLKDLPKRAYYSLELKQQIESLLFASGKLMTEKDLSMLTGGTPGAVKKALEELKKDYEMRDTSIILMQSGEGWKLNVRERFVNLVTKIVADTELPFPILETLSLIAYKAPVMQADLIKARGTNAYEHVQLLIDAGFVERRKKGRSFEMGLTPKFFEYFDVPGEQHLKQLLKDVKASEPKKKKLGNLDVVDLPGDKKDESGKEAAKGKLGELEVVDALPEDGEFVPALPVIEKKPYIPGDQLEKQRPGFETIKPDDDFLKRIDDQINQMSKKYDSMTDDELFKKPVQPLGEGQEALEPAGDANAEANDSNEAPGNDDGEPKAKNPALTDDEDTENEEPGEAEEEEHEEKADSN